MAIYRNLRIFSIILIVAILLSLSACTEKNTLKSIEECYYIRTNNNELTYAYEVTDFEGNILLSDSAAFREPKIRTLSSSVIEVSTQTGTGLSTNWAVYCNVETGAVSDKFSYVLGAKDEYVLYVQYEAGTHYIICQNIFDSNATPQEYKVEDEHIILDSLSKADFDTEGVAKISYLSGDTAMTEKYITINFPN